MIVEPNALTHSDPQNAQLMFGDVPGSVGHQRGVRPPHPNRGDTTDRRTDVEPPPLRPWVGLSWSQTDPFAARTFAWVREFDRMFEGRLCAVPSRRQDQPGTNRRALRTGQMRGWPVKPQVSAVIRALSRSCAQRGTVPIRTSTLAPRSCGPVRGAARSALKGHAPPPDDTTAGQTLFHGPQPPVGIDDARLRVR